MKLQSNVLKDYLPRIRSELQFRSFRMKVSEYIYAIYVYVIQFCF